VAQSLLEFAGQQSLGLPPVQAAELMAAKDRAQSMSLGLPEDHFVESKASSGSSRFQSVVTPPQSPRSGQPKFVLFGNSCFMADDFTAPLSPTEDKEIKGESKGDNKDEKSIDGLYCLLNN
jgi:hypothetical protein